MPLFYIPKPRRFHYEPRFYDPRKEKWEALKAKYADEQQTRQAAELQEGELEYFEEKVRQLERSDRQKNRGLTWKDAFRKREMPQFHYTPRFSTDVQQTASEHSDTATERVEEAKERHFRIKRRFDLSHSFQRKQQSVWVKVAVVLMIFYLVYRFYGAITSFIYNLFF